VASGSRLEGGGSSIVLVLSEAVLIIDFSIFFRTFDYEHEHRNTFRQLKAERR